MGAKAFDTVSREGLLLKCFAHGIQGGTIFKKIFNNIAIQGTPQMAVDKEDIGLSRVYSYYSTCSLPLFYV